LDGDISAVATAFKEPLESRQRQGRAEQHRRKTQMEGGPRVRRIKKDRFPGWYGAFEEQAFLN
jgi:hypothetical protein